MESDRRGRKQENPFSSPASLYFNEDLSLAIRKGNLYDTVAALNQQGKNNVTEAISNHLIARSFLVRQKEDLFILYEQIAEAATIREVVERVGEYTVKLGESFDDLFVTEETDGKFAKLSGDGLFRAALQTPEEGRAVIARRIADVDVSALLPQDQLFYAMETAQDSIAEDLWGGVHNLRERGLYPDTIEEMRGVVAKQISAVDDSIINNLPRAKASE